MDSEVRGEEKGRQVSGSRFRPEPENHRLLTQPLDGLKPQDLATCTWPTQEQEKRCLEPAPESRPRVKQAAYAGSQGLRSI